MITIDNEEIKKKYLSGKNITEQKENITEILKEQKISNAILDKRLIDEIFRGAVKYCEKEKIKFICI